MYDWLIQSGCKVILLNGGRGFKVNSTLAALVQVPLLIIKNWLLSKKLYKIAQENCIDILHCHWLPHQILAGFIRSKNLKVIWHIHNNTSYTRLFGLSRKINLLLARWGADIIMPVSEYIGNNWKASGKLIRVVRNGVYPYYDAPNQPNNDPIKCVIAGRLCEDKGHHLAVAAVINANKKGYKVCLDIFGGPIENNPYYDKLRLQVIDNNLEDSIRFLGFRNDLRENHQKYDLGLQCRIEPEPCGVWICETLVDGLPLIASRTGGTPELVEDGVTGLLFEGNSIADLTEKLINLISVKEKLITMRQAAYLRGRDKFTVDRFISETQAVYCALQQQ
ncbi:glycosyl transferase group 1 [Methylomonas methanica MC09]|uniref:Glycosyl transferase group 1 n=2 Tax=Methylomonas methanica TaxID=421 RepID=G0A1G5_METMM|nr:glycosyl transferase group 1 [Methylomonas methanica MC09]